MIKIITLITKFIVATLLALLFSSCWHTSSFNSGIEGSGNITTKIKNTDQNFKKIEVRNGIKVIIEQANTTSVTVKIDDNLQQHIITEIENGVLKIESDKNFNSSEIPVVNVKMPFINSLKASEASEIISKNILITENLNVESSSASSIKIAIEADFIKMESTSGSKIEVSGKALKSETYSASGSQIDAENLMTNEVIAKSESGSSTAVYPILKLEAKASSGSKISYNKKVKTLSKEESSGGSVQEE